MSRFFVEMGHEVLQKKEKRSTLKVFLFSKMKRYHFYIFGFLLLFITSITFAWHQNSEEAPSIFPAKKNTEKPLTETKKSLSEDIKMFNQAIIYKNLDACRKIQTENEKKRCEDEIRLEKITQSGSIEECKILNFSKKQQQCHDNIVENSAIKAKNLEICQKILDENTQKRCQEKLQSEILKNLIERGNIKKDDCKALNGKFLEECQEKIFSEENSKKYHRAIANGKIEQCYALSEKKSIQNCQDETLFSMAKKENNAFLCEKISHSHLKKSCQEYFLEKFENEIFETAVKNQNIYQCSQISQRESADQCHDTIVINMAKTRKETKLCPLVKNPLNKNICWQIDNL